MSLKRDYILILEPVKSIIVNKNIFLNLLKVKDVMTKNPISINKDVLAAKALSLMNSKRITSLCVYENKVRNKTIGVIHIHNILENNIQ